MTTPRSEPSAPTSADRLRTLRRVPFAVVLLVSLYAFFVPADHVPTDVPTSDKVIHGGLFAALLVTGWLAGLRLLPLVAGLIGYAVVSEILQATLPINRDGNVPDAVADSIGVLVGVVVAGVGARLVRSRR